MDLTKQFNNKDASDVSDDFDASGVTFEVQDTDGNVYNLIKNDDGNYSIWTGKVQTVNATVDGKSELVSYAVTINQKEDGTLDENKATTLVAPIVTSANPTSTGSLVTKGFEAGTYNLVETASVDGYSILTAPISIVVEEVKDKADDTVVTGSVKASVLESDDTKQELTNNADNDGAFEITVNNSKNQFNLPTTGGLGLWMFTIAGGVIMAGAIIFIAVMRKKKNA